MYGPGRLEAAVDRIVEDDAQGNLVSAHFVWDSGSDRGFNRRVVSQSCLNLQRRNVFTRAPDDIFPTIDECEITVFQFYNNITGVAPAICPNFGSGLRVF